MVPLLTLFEAFIDSCKAQGYFRNCTDCFNWNEKNDKCNKFNVKPPTRVLVKGCEEYEEIPF